MNPDYLLLLQNALIHNTAAIVDTQKGAQTEVALLKMSRNLTGLN